MKLPILLATCWLFASTQSGRTRATYSDNQRDCEAKRTAYIEQACHRPGVLVEQCLEDMPMSVKACRECDADDPNAQ